VTRKTAVASTDDARTARSLSGEQAVGSGVAARCWCRRWRDGCLGRLELQGPPRRGSDGGALQGAAPSTACWF